MQSTKIIIVAGVLGFLLFLGGCASPAPKKYSAASVRIYAQLLVMYEKQKLFSSIPDSVYGKNVSEFFIRRGMDEDEFKKQIEELSRDDAAWRTFLSEATAAVDSIKTAKPA